MLAVVVDDGPHEQGVDVALQENVKGKPLGWLGVYELEVLNHPLLRMIVGIAQPDIVEQRLGAKDLIFPYQD